jgi:endoribonuclease Dicer
MVAMLRQHFGEFAVSTHELGLTVFEIVIRNLESNLDCTIRAPRIHRQELASFVHRPRFRHVLYTPPDLLNPPYSRNLTALDSVMATLDIEDDPYVKSLRKQLKNLAPGAERTRLDQKLSMTILKNNSYTHKGLADFARAASEICEDVGPWAADWYIEKVLQQAKAAAGPHQNLLNAWKGKEKAYLLGLLNQVDISPVSYDPQDIVMGTSAKVQALVDCLNAEKADAESHDEAYSGIIFVTRRDTVLALAEVIAHHPRTADHFDVGCLLGASESAYRQTFLDITRKLSPKSHEDTLEDFRLGEKNLIVSTSVAEEGIDIQACGSVIRWNIPANMVSWAQSRGRARRKRSTFIVMFEEGGAHEKEVLRWEALEQEMVDLYNNDARPVNEPISHMAQLFDNEDEDDENIEFRVESTGWVRRSYI